ncbi:MAG TPA: DNA primase [Chlamydiales bacterium]|nr:DNA primase [Chlamydiales bacterium]
MPRYTRESLEELRTRIDLVEVMRPHVDLKKAGASWKACCPFHDERTPSFVIGKGDSHYHCFGCGAHGDAIQFLMQHLKMDFADACQSLAERFQVPLKEVEGNGQQKDPGYSRGKLKEILEKASLLYQFMLLETDEGKSALKYMFERGITRDFLITFRIGLAPKHDGLLKRFLKSEGKVNDELLEAAGLINANKKEFFLERITFPIQDAQGAIIGFSARKFREEVFGGKYINTKETELFKKSRVLFGLSHSRKRIAKEKEAIIVEGQLDALRLIYNGFDFTVAALGTAFGDEHMRELIKLGVQRVFLLFDGDEAGFTAAIKVGDLFQKEGIEVRVGKMADGVDPDDLLLKEGPNGIVKTLFAADEYLLFLYEQLSKKFNPHSPAEKNQLVQEIAQRVRGWNNPVMIYESIKKLAHLAKVPEELLGSSIRSGVAPALLLRSGHALFHSGKKELVDPTAILEGDLLRLLIMVGGSKPEQFLCVRRNLNEEAFHYPLAKKLFLELIKSDAAKRPFDLLQLAESESDGQELAHYVSGLMRRRVNYEKAADLIAETVLKIKERNWLLARDEIMQKIQTTDKTDPQLLELVKRFDELKREPPKII